MVYRFVSEVIARRTYTISADELSVNFGLE